MSVKFSSGNPRCCWICCANGGIWQFRHVLSFICYIFVGMIKRRWGFDIKRETIYTRNFSFSFYLFCKELRRQEGYTRWVSLFYGSVWSFLNMVFQASKEQGDMSLTGFVEWNANQVLCLVRRTICYYLLLCHRHVLNFDTLDVVWVKLSMDLCLKYELELTYRGCPQPVLAYT